MWRYAFIPVLVATFGALLTIARPPSDAIVSAVQHFAAGVILYAAAGRFSQMPRGEGASGRSCWAE
jgi:ZIP family zinc transporter